MKTFSAEIIVTDDPEIDDDTLAESISNMLDENGYGVVSVAVSEEE